MRAAALVLLVFLLGLLATSAAGAQVEEVPRPPAAMSDEMMHLPIQNYYNRNFFEEPWRLPGTWRGIALDAAVVAGIDLVLYLAWMRWRRWRWD